MVVALVVGLFALLVWKTIFAGSSELTNAVRAGERPAAPAFELPVIWNQNQTWPRKLRTRSDDGRVALAELRGYPVVLNFWASWCGPCKDEAPILEAASKRWAGKVTFVGIDVKDFRGDARDFVERYAITYPNVYDGKGSTVGRYGVTGFPETYFVDAEGRVRYRIAGPVQSAEEIDDGIRRALAPL